MLGYLTGAANKDKRQDQIAISIGTDNAVSKVIAEVIGEMHLYRLRKVLNRYYDGNDD